MNENTPIRHALKYALSPYNKPKGRPKLTWISMMKEEFKNVNITWEEAFELSKNKKQWEHFRENL